MPHPATRLISLTYPPVPLCGYLPSTTCLCTLIHPYPVTHLPNGSGCFRAKPFPVSYPSNSQTLFILHTLTCLWRWTRQCSETSAYKLQTPANYPEGSTGYNLFACKGTRSVNKVMRLAAYRTIWQHCGLALHMKVR